MKNKITLKTKSNLNYALIILLSTITFWWTFYIFHIDFDISVVAIVVGFRIVASRFILQDHNMSWSKASQKTFLIKSFVYIVAFFGYLTVFYQEIHVYFLASELFLYLFAINFIMYAYYDIINRSGVRKTKTVVIYGAGEAGIKLEKEFKHSEYKIAYFCDDDKKLQRQSIDNISIIGPDEIKKRCVDTKLDLLVIAIPSIDKSIIKSIHTNLTDCFHEIQILPAIDEILQDTSYSKQLKDISVEDLLARHPKDLDKDAIAQFIKDKTVLITGAGGSIGSEIVRQCVSFKAKKLILVDHSEFNLYQIEQEVLGFRGEGLGVSVFCVMQSVLNIKALEKTFDKYNPDIVIHAAAYKHVPLCEENIEEAINNNIIGTKNSIDLSIKYGVEKFVLISTDKAVRPTNVMGTTKRICELYATNVNSKATEIVAVRFGNVLGSSGSVIPKFKAQIEAGQNITVTHKDITRYFMLIPEACELVLQAGSLGKGGELFILDMGEPIKIVDLAKKMI
ncbi:MAG: nucleoside-diphosphate sugar epimerase/dehydratase, partial [Campylobacterota bacterium]|nr:nucleoside-diphosphate sugar epimerase/dehydratase [Campylobacterota bacterium]